MKTLASFDKMKAQSEQRANQSPKTFKQSHVLITQVSTFEGIFKAACGSPTLGS